MIVGRNGIVQVKPRVRQTGKVGMLENEARTDAKRSIRMTDECENGSTRKEQEQTMKLAIENATRASKTTVATEMAPTGLLLYLDRAVRGAEDAAMDAEDILMQAEEANALDPVG